MKTKWLWALAVGVVGAAFYVGNVLATPAVGFVGTTLAKGTFPDLDSHVQSEPEWQEKIKTKGLSDLYVQQNTWQPGGSSGWHTHPGPSFIIVTQGSVTAYDGGRDEGSPPEDGACTPHVYTANTPNNAFVDPGGGHVHIIRNETNAIAQSITVQLVPAGATRRVDVADAPPNCQF